MSPILGTDPQYLPNLGFPINRELGKTITDSRRRQLPQSLIGLSKDPRGATQGPVE